MSTPSSRPPAARASLPDGARAPGLSQRGAYALWTYEPSGEVLFVSHPEPVELLDSQQIAAYFQEGRERWRAWCGGQKVYVLVDYDGLATNESELDFYAAQVRQFSTECALDIVRYNGSMLQRIAGRWIAMQNHVPSNIYGSREEALAVVAALRSGAIKSVPP